MLARAGTARASTTAALRAAVTEGVGESASRRVAAKTVDSRISRV